MFVDDRFLSHIVKDMGQHPVSNDYGTWYPPQECKCLKIDYIICSSFEKIIIERTIQCIKNRTRESFDDNFLFKRKKCELKQV